MSIFSINNLRPVLAAVGFAGAFMASPWVPMLAIVLLSLRFRAIEAIVIGFYTDMLWQAGGFPNVLPLYTIAAIIIVWGLEPLRLEFLR